MTLPILCLLALTIKHFICDFPLQATPWMYKNKSIYGHSGGLAHAAVHAIGTEIALSFCGMSSGTLLYAALFDGIIHYHIDWAKMNIGAHFNLKPDNSEWFWILLGFDQLLHYLTYFAIVLIFIS